MLVGFGTFKLGSTQRKDDNWRNGVVIIIYLDDTIVTGPCTPDINQAIHARESHTKAVKLVEQYLVPTRDKCMIYTPTHGFLVCYCDANFSGKWNPDIIGHDSSATKSRLGYVINYVRCPVIWTSQLQPQFTLSLTEAKYIALSQSLRDVILFMRLICERHIANFVMPLLHL
jgi:hypothetical protein